MVSTRVLYGKISFLPVWILASWFAILKHSGYSDAHYQIGVPVQLLTYILVVGAILVVCFIAMAVGLIFRNKTFTSCGSAARDFDGEPITCAACGGKNQESCRRQQQKANG
jgi:hypothetical protein